MCTAAAAASALPNALPRGCRVCRRRLWCALRGLLRASAAAQLHALCPNADKQRKRIGAAPQEIQLQDSWGDAKSLQPIAFATRRRGWSASRPRDAPLRARYWLHRGTHCSWQALSGTPRSDSCIGRPCHAAEDELGPARLATLLGILSALGRRSKTHRAQQRAVTRSAPAPSFEAQ